MAHYGRSRQSYYRLFRPDGAQADEVSGWVHLDYDVIIDWDALEPDSDIAAFLPRAGHLGDAAEPRSDVAGGFWGIAANTPIVRPNLKRRSAPVVLAGLMILLLTACSGPAAQPLAFATPGATARPATMT